MTKSLNTPARRLFLAAASLVTAAAMLPMSATSSRASTTATIVPAAMSNARATVHTLPVNTVNVNNQTTNTQGTSIGPAVVQASPSATFKAAATMAAKSTASVTLPSSIPAGSLVSGAAAGHTGIQRAEHYLTDATGKTAHITNGHTVRFDYTLTPFNLEASDHSNHSFMVVSQLIGPMEDGSWQDPLAEVMVQWVGKQPHYVLSGGLRDGEYYTLDTGVAATTGVARHIVFTTVMAGPGKGSVSLTIDGRTVASIKPAKGVVVPSYVVAKYGFYGAQYLGSKANRFVAFQKVSVKVS